MKLNIDKNWIICVDEVINHTKEYSHNLSWFSFSSYDEMVIAKHKKEIKILNWKNIGDGMSVFCFVPREEIILQGLNKISFKGYTSSWFSLWFGMFQWFDEQTWSKNHFLYKISEKELENINKFLNIDSKDIKLSKTDKWVFVNWEILSRENVDDNMLNDLDFLTSFLFSLTLIYWKLEVKNAELISAKIHVPLFWVHENKKDLFDKIVENLRQKWVFLQKSLVNSNSWIVYQISCQDYEILCSFRNLCKDFLSIEKVQKLEYKQEINQILNNFVKENPEFENSEEFIKKIQTWIIKTLNK